MTSATCEAPTVKKRKVSVDKGDRLPKSCPLSTLSEWIKAIVAQDEFYGNNKFQLREIVSFYNGYARTSQLMNM